MRYSLIILLGNFCSILTFGCGSAGQSAASKPIGPAVEAPKTDAGVISDGGLQPEIAIGIPATEPEPIPEATSEPEPIPEATPDPDPSPEEVTDPSAPHQFFETYVREVGEWMTKAERTRLEKIDITATGSANEKRLSVILRHRILRDLVPQALQRSRVRHLKTTAADLRNAPKPTMRDRRFELPAIMHQVVYNAFYGDLLYMVCERNCEWDWKAKEPCRKCQDGSRKLSPLITACRPIDPETLRWRAIREMAEGEIPGIGSSSFVEIFENSQNAGVPRNRIVGFAIRVLKQLVRIARRPAE